MLRNPREAMTYTLFNSETQRAFRIMNGNAAAHFRLRHSSWQMAILNLCVGLGMCVNPGMLVDNPGAQVYWGHLVAFISPNGWRDIFLFLGSARLAALYVNGTYPSIWWTPHVRLLLSVASFLIWVQFGVSLVMSGILSIGTFLFASTALKEWYNITIAAHETLGTARD